MIEDIVVNKIVQDEGFAALAPRYLDIVKKEIAAALEGKDYYAKYAYSPVFKNRFMVFRFILAWGCMRYHNLKPAALKTLGRFLKQFHLR